MFLRTVVCFLLLTCGCGAFAQEPGNRVALVIGNAAYKRGALANPVNDAKLMAERLKAQGFEVSASYDASQRDMKRAVQAFAATLRERGKDVVAFVFYAGHGVQVKGENYLIPVDEHIEAEGDVDIDAVSLSSIMSMLENTQTRLAIVVLDACRDNPFGYARGGQRGLARVDAPSGSLVAFSTSPGKAALDGPAGSNSYYTAALAQAITEPGQKIEEVFKKVRIAVREKTKGEQTPWESTSLTGDFYPAAEKPGRAAAQTEPPHAQLQQTAIAKPESRPAPAMHYENAAQRLVVTFTGHTDMISSVAFSPDGRTLASGSDDTNVKLWDATSGQELRTLSGHMGRVESVAFSPDGRWIASGASTFNESSVVKLWDAVSGRELRTLTGHARLVLGANPSVVAFSPDSSVLASGGWDGAIYLWDVSSGRELRTLAGPKGRVNSLAFSPDGRTFASGSDDVEIKLWDVTNGQELRTLTGHKYAVQSVAFSPDGRTLASASLDTTVKLWDVASGRELRTLKGHIAYVTHLGPMGGVSVAFSPNGLYLLSGGCASHDAKNECIEGALKLWNIGTGQQLHEFTGHAGEVSSVAFSPDGDRAVSSSYDKTLKLWDISEWTRPQVARH